MVATLPVSLHVSRGADGCRHAIRQLRQVAANRPFCLAQALLGLVSAAKNDVILTRRHTNQCLVSKRRRTVSTLNEIAANHARMAKAKEQESIRLSGLHAQVVGSFEMPPVEAKQEMPLHIMVAVQDHAFAEGVALVF